MKQQFKKHPVRKKVLGLVAFLLVVILCSHAKINNQPTQPVARPCLKEESKQAKITEDVNDIVMSLKSLSLLDLRN